MITVTTQAVAQIREAASQNDAAGMALRIAARREADGSIQYGMGFDDTREGDVEIDAEGQIVLVSPVHAELLSGATLDYVELQPGDFRFIFMNPNDTGGCAPKPGGGGCGGCGGGCH